MFPAILIGILVVGIVVFAAYIRRNPFDQIPRKEKPGDCDESCLTCMDTCAASKVLQAEMSPVGDFNDDELDAFAGTDAGSYSDEQVELFAAILEGLKPSEVAPWMESLRRRNIALPAALRDEALMLVEGQ